jgi:hypothetical protein
MSCKYETPALKNFPTLSLSPMFTQYLICEGEMPADCSRIGQIGFGCLNGSRVEGSFIIPGITCADSPECSVFINGQPAEIFCGGAQQFGLGPGIDCGGGCFYEPSCDIVNGTCSGGELVEVQCTGFTGCEILMI